MQILRRRFLFPGPDTGPVLLSYALFFISGPFSVAAAQ